MDLDTFKTVAEELHELDDQALNELFYEVKDFNQDGVLSDDSKIRGYARRISDDSILQLNIVCEMVLYEMASRWSANYELN